MQAGSCKKNITVPELFVGTPPINDPLCASALVLDDGENAVAIICLDIAAEFFPEVCERIREKLGINCTLVNCSHVHSDGRGGRKEGWNERVGELIYQAVEEAHESRVPVSLHTGRAPAQVGFNRRLPDENGVPIMAVNKDGAVVPWVNVLEARGENGKPLTVLFEHAAHPVITMTSGAIGADFPGHAIKRINQELGDDVNAFFAQGCGANINGYPVSFDVEGGWHENAETAGTKLGDAVLEAMRSSKEIKGDKLKLRSTRVTLPTQELPSMEVWREAYKGVRVLSTAVPGSHEYKRQEELLQSIKEMIERNEWSPSEVQFNINGVMLGTEWCLITFPSEMFCEYELWVDETAPFSHNMTFGYTNEGVGYIATDKELALGDKGGYEAGCFPCLWSNAVRRPLAVGMEGIIKEGVASLWTE